MNKEGLVKLGKERAVEIAELLNWEDCAELPLDGKRGSEMAAANIRGVIRLRSCLWLGVITLLPVMAGCNSVAPFAIADRPANSDTRLPPSDRAGTIQRVGFNETTDSPVFRASLGGPVAVSKEGQSPLAADLLTQTADRMTFDEAVKATLVADPKIRAGFEAIVQAQGDLLTSKLLPNPTVLVDGLLLSTRAVTPQRTSGPPQTDLIASYPIDWFLFGKRTAAMASARLGVRQSEADYADLIRQRVLACASAFFDLVEAKELVKLTHEDRANFKKVETITEKALKAGNRTKVDLDRVKLDLLKSEQSVREAESMVAVAKAKLRALLGRADADLAFDIEADIDSPLSAELIALEEAYALAQENRPDIQSLQVQVAKADADVVVENRKRYPEITPGFGWTHQFQAAAIGQADSDTLNFLVSTTVPMFNRNQGNRLKAQSVAAQNRFLLESARVDLRAEVTQVFQEFQTAEKNARAIAEGQKKAAKDVLDAITKSYEVVGGRPYVDVLDAQRSYRETYRAYITSRVNYWRAVYRFSAAIGQQITPR